MASPVVFLPSDAAVPSQAVSRSSELLACARTALRLLQCQQENISSAKNANLPVTELQLYSYPVHSDHWLHHTEAEDHVLSPVQKAINDASQILRVLDSIVTELQALVRRKGHTNDPSDEIAACVKRFQSLMSEYVDDVKAIPSTINSPAQISSNRQMERHYEVIAQHLLSQGKRRAFAFQKSLEKRGEVLKEQAQRRKLLRDGHAESGTDGTACSFASISDIGEGSAVAVGLTIKSSLTYRPSGNLASLYSASSASTHSNAPLFTRTTGMDTSLSRKKPTDAATTSSAEIISDISSLTSSGMRQRKKGADGLLISSTTNIARKSTYLSSGYASAYQSAGYGYQFNGTIGTDQPSHDNQNSQTQMQLQNRRQARETKARLENARQAERTIHELGTMFSKMASLIHSQAQHIEKIEDDVELAQNDVAIGHEEITKLFDITKGNRLLIIKVFAVLIMMILFLRLY